MIKFTIQCDFGGKMAPFTVYLGQPKDGNHPLHFQADWLARHRGGIIPAEFMQSIEKIKKLADENNLAFEEVCAYALNEADIL